VQKTILHFLHFQSYNLSNFLKFQKALKFEQQKPKTKIQKLNNAIDWKSYMIWNEKKLPYGKQEFMGNYFRFIFEQNLTQNFV
jgi:hypothetical protein